jgi:pimeloyl-ACP methyl ester carboxylesterase
MAPCDADARRRRLPRSRAGLPGRAHSWRPAGGYDKRPMAEDIHRLLREHLRIPGPIVLAGHDIGLMVAYLYAAAHPDEVSQLVVMDAPLPGTASIACARIHGCGISLQRHPRGRRDAGRREGAAVPAGLLQFNESAGTRMSTSRGSGCGAACSLGRGGQDLHLSSRDISSCRFLRASAARDDQPRSW